MTDSNGFSADPGRIEANANQVDALVPLVGMVANAGAQVSPSAHEHRIPSYLPIAVVSGHPPTAAPDWDNAYGVACQAFPMAMGAHLRRQLDAIGRLADAFAATARRLDGTARTYHDTEQRNHDLMRRHQRHPGEPS